MLFVGTEMVRGRLAALLIIVPFPSVSVSAVLKLCHLFPVAQDLKFRLSFSEVLPTPPYPLLLKVESQDR